MSTPSFLLLKSGTVFVIAGASEREAHDELTLRRLADHAGADVGTLLALSILADPSTECWWTTTSTAVLSWPQESSGRCRGGPAQQWLQQRSSLLQYAVSILSAAKAETI